VHLAKAQFSNNRTTNLPRKTKQQPTGNEGEKLATKHTHSMTHCKYWTQGESALSQIKPRMIMRVKTNTPGTIKQERELARW